MAQRKSFLLRIDPAVLDALQRWADDDLRSLNGQIEFLLRSVLQEKGRKIRPASPADSGEQRSESDPAESHEEKRS